MLPRTESGGATGSPNHLNTLTHKRISCRAPMPYAAKFRHAVATTTRTCASPGRHGRACTAQVWHRGSASAGLLRRDAPCRAVRADFLQDVEALELGMSHRH